MTRWTPRLDRSLVLGVLLLVSGQWTLSFLDTAGKTLGQLGFHVVMISWVRYLGHTIVLGLIFGPKLGRRLWQSGAPRLQFVRALIMLATTLLFFSTLVRLPLAQATTMSFLTPLFVVALAPLVLREHGSITRWIGVAIGFVGMLIVVRPGSHLDPVGVAFGLANAFCMAWFQMLTRKVATVDSPLTTLFLSGAIGTLVCSLAVAWFWPTGPITTKEFLIFLSTGVTGSLGHYLVILAFRRAPASVLSPFMYLQIVSATTIGALVFGQLPDGLTALGIGVICAAGVFVALTEKRRAAPLAQAI